MKQIVVMRFAIVMSAIVMLAIVMSAASVTLAQEITTESLLNEMVNRDALAQFPHPAYTCRQASSYDRDTVAPDKPGWFANADRSQWIRVEQNEGRTEHVMLDAAGPGAIVRFWATWHGPGGGPFSNGTLRIYLDNQPKPVIEGPIATILDQGALAEPPLAEGVSPETIYAHRGHNLYFPIPYSTHCKVTYDTSVLIDRGARKGEALYYQINYRTYEASAQVASFSMEQLQEIQPRVKQTQTRLLQSGLVATTDLQSIAKEDCMITGKSCSTTLEGPAAIREFTLKLDTTNLAQALRSTVLAIEFDGEPCVWAPVGEFFGTGYQMHPYRSWYTEVAKDGQLTCYWTMPFERSCRITVTNYGDQPVKIALARIRYGSWDWDARSMHFHAAWHQFTKIHTRRGSTAPGAGAFDVNYVEVKGEGVYVGDTLTIFNGANGWWGEGDEKIYVDGEPFPSHIGTGSEDYYGYAWCRPEYFQSPFHAQPCGAGNLHTGFSVNSRYRALDAIPFTNGLKFDMELWHWVDTFVNYAPTTFWYGRPGTSCNVEPDPDTARKAVAIARSDVVETFHAPNAIEGESLKIIAKSGGTTQTQDIGDYGWSDDAQLWWRDGNVGDRLVLEFPVSKAGTHEVAACLTKAIDYGIVKVQVNDEPPQQFDRFNRRVAHDKIALGTFDLPRGSNRLTIEITGANPNAVKKHMFGLDYLQLVPKK